VDRDDFAHFGFVKKSFSLLGRTLKSFF